MADALTYLSWLRRGFGAAVEASALPMDGNVEVTLEFPPNEARLKLTLVGPGNIVGLDSRTIIRTFPRRDDNDAEHKYFAAIDFLSAFRWPSPSG